MKKIIKPTITATIRTPTHTPALKIPPITSQPDKVATRKMSIQDIKFFIQKF